jgi:hypothetical protein
VWLVRVGADVSLRFALYYVIAMIMCVRYFRYAHCMVFMKSLRTFANSSVQVACVGVMLSVTCRYDLL